MVSASGPEAAFTVIARDRASKILDSLNAKLGTTTQQFSRLTSIVLRATAVLQGLALVLPVVGALIAGMIAGVTIISMIEFSVATRRARLQLQFMGLDATNARAATDALSAALDRATATSLLQNKDAVAGVAVAGADLAVALGLMAQELALITGLDVTEVFNALIQARLFDNVEPLLRLVGGITDLGISLSDLAKTSPEGMLEFLQQFLSSENVTHAEGLASAMKDLAEFSLPGREAISEMVITFLLIMITSLTERIKLLQNEFETVVFGALAGAMIGAGSGLGGILAGAIIGGLVTLLFLNFNDAMDTFFTEPLIVANITAAAIIVGQATGRGLLAGIVLFLGVALLPGLKQEFDRLALDQQLGVTVAFLGVALGLALKLRFIQAVGLGLALREAALDLISGNETRVTFGLLGSVIGVALGGGIVGGVIGFFASTTLFDLIQDTGWFRGIDFVFAVLENVADNALNAVARTVIKVFEFMGQQIVDSLNEVIGSLNDLIGFKNSFGRSIFPLIPPIPPFNLPDRGAFDPVPFPQRRQPNPNNPFNPQNPLPGLPFSPQLPGIPGQPAPNAPIIITIMLDKRVIGEVAVDAVRREFKFKAGIVPGFSL